GGRSRGPSTGVRSVASKPPPPETSRHANRAVSRISATRSTSAVGSCTARGSCESRRIVVSTSFGTTRDLSEARQEARSGPADVPTLAGIDLDAFASVHEEWNLDDSAGLEGGGL